MLLLLWPLAGDAQKRPARPRPAPATTAAWPIESLAVEGNSQYSSQQILAVAGLKAGQTVTPKDIDAARQRLLDSGAFDSVGWKYGPGRGGKGYAVSFQVSEVAPLFPVRFEDLPAPVPELEGVLRRTNPMFGPKIPASEPVLARYAKALEAYLAGKNFKDKVVGKVAPDDAGQLAAVFRPATPPPAVARVKFTGNQVVPSSALQLRINAVAVGMPYEEARFRQLLDANVRPLYEARGRVGVSFLEIQTEKEKDVQGLVLTVKVEEGASYSLGQVQVSGTEYTSADLVKTGNFKRGDVFNIDQIQAGIARIEQRVRHTGYVDVKSHIEKKVNEQAKTVDVMIRVDPGPRYTFGQLNIQGLDLISEPAIRKMWVLKEGEPFNPDYPDYFLQRIREDGVLDNLGETKAVLKRDDQNRRVDVTLLFKGEPPKPAERKRERNW